MLQGNDLASIIKQVNGYISKHIILLRIEYFLQAKKKKKEQTLRSDWQFGQHLGGLEGADLVYNMNGQQECGVIQLLQYPGICHSIASNPSSTNT